MLENTNDMLGATIEVQEKIEKFQNYIVKRTEQVKNFKVVEPLNLKEWGEFFPTSISAFGYNETVAQEYFRLSESEVKEK